MNFHNLNRVNILKAKQVVILAPHIEHEKVSVEEQSSQIDQSKENLLDAQTIFKYNMIKKKNPNIKIVTELFF